MALAVSLSEASYLSYDQCNIHRVAGNLATQLQAFVAAVKALPQFDDTVVNASNIGDWLIPLTPLSTGLSTPPTPDQVNQAAEILFRMCSLAASMQASALIDGGAAAALLAAWNAEIGT